MATLTADDFAQQMIAQARVLDPSLSCAVGTPERKIIDTVAQALAENQIDLTGLQGALDIDSKFGSNLDRYTALFGFQRQQAAAATGYVVFSRNTPAPANITIPLGTVIQVNTSATQGILAPMQYTTTAAGTIAVNQTSSGAVPVQAISTGISGNAAANTLTIMVGTPAPGVTAVTNPNPLINGVNAEDDNSYKVRFKNTWARNLAGTQDQYLALAIAGPFTTKANIIGAQSRFQEYIQVPDYDDAGYLNGALVNPVSGQSAQLGTENTMGVQNSWTTALSTIPYAKQVYSNMQVFVSNGEQGLTQSFYRSGVDFQFNSKAVVAGDTIRATQTTAIASNQNPISSNQVQVTTTTGFPSSGALIVFHNNVPTQVVYTGLSASPVAFTGVPAGINVDANTPVYLVPNITQVQPNFTFLNTYNPAVSSTIAGLQALTPGQVVLSEYSYVSSASRNDITRNINNAVDIYADGHNDIQTSCIFLTTPQPFTFNTNPNSPWYYENYRRDGEPAKRPRVGSFFTPLFQTPIDSLPNTITINNTNFFSGVHYWLVHETDSLGGSIRARDGIEWNSSLYGDSGGTAPTSMLTPYFPYTASAVNIATSGQTVSINNYTYDANIPTLQAAIESSRQITTDVVVHQASMRYFKLDITVIYTNNTNPTVVNSAIATAIQAFFDRQYFGAVIQLSTLLEVIHEVQGVENVRWSNDITLVPDLIRVEETNINGNPLHGTTIGRLFVGHGAITSGPGAVAEQQSLYIVGSPSGTFNLSWTDTVNLPGSHTVTTAAINFQSTNGTSVTASTIQSAIQTAMTSAGIASGAYSGITITQDVRPTVGVSRPILSFTLQYGTSAAYVTSTNTGGPVVPSVINNVTASNYAFDGDFYLLDNELPSLPTGQVTGDTVPGLIIRPRAQNTFSRPGLG